MVARTTLFLGLVAAVVAEPIPQDSSAAPTAAPSAFPTSFDTAGLASTESSLMAEESVLSSIFSGIPTLPASVESVLVTAIPTSIITETDYLCQIRTATPDWYNSLPADVKSALSSYETAAESWLSAHSAVLASFESSVTAGQTFSTPSLAYQTPVACTGAAPGGASGNTATATGTSGGKTSAGGASATGAGSGSSTASGTAASSSKSSAGAASTGAVTLGAAGVVGMLGLLAAL